jgi:four helix bundle protein
MSGRVRDFDDLRVYRSGFALAEDIFESSGHWPREETYALTDQIRRASRSVCANIAEAWSKRRYEAHFVKNLSTAEGEAAETIVWLDFARSCGYLNDAVHTDLRDRYGKLRGGLIRMMANPTPWCGPAALREPDLKYDSDLDRQTGFD